MLCGSGDAYLQPVCVCMCVPVIYHYFDPSKSMFEDLIDIHGSNRLLDSWGKERGGGEGRTKSCEKEESS